MQYKKAQGVAIVVILIIAVLAISLFGLGSYIESRKQTALAEKQTALLQKEDKKTVEEKSETTNIGKSAIARASALDLQSNTQAQVGVPAYFYTVDKDGKFKEYVGQTSARTLSATDSTSITPVVIGDKLCGRVFNTTGGQGGEIGYYGIEKCTDIQVGGETLILDSHRICRINQLQGYLKTNLNALGRNLTAGVSQANSFASIELRINGTDCAYNLGGFYVDTSAGTNIQDVGMGEAVTKGATTSKLTETNLNLKRLSAIDDYVFELDEPILIKEYETVITGAFTILADGDGCSSAEAVNVTAFDVAPYQSAKLAGRPIITKGIEDDQVSPVDVGGADVPIVSSGRGTSAVNDVNGDGTTSFYCVP